MKTEQLAAQFDAMTPADHETMKERLKELARVSAPKPEADTLEGYALRQYTTAPANA